MNADTLMKIKTECEKVEKDGFGEVTLKIKNGAIYLVEKKTTTLLEQPETLPTNRT